MNCASAVLGEKRAGEAVRPGTSRARLGLPMRSVVTHPTWTDEAAFAAFRSFFGGFTLRFTYFVVHWCSLWTAVECKSTCIAQVPARGPLRCAAYPKLLLHEGAGCCRYSKLKKGQSFLSVAVERRNESRSSYLSGGLLCNAD